ncbi:MAG: IS4 family transposase [Bacteroidota bacterium]
MNKSTFFSGQPIFAQLLKFVPKDTVLRIAHDSKSDHYCKRFSTYEHLVTILYAIYNNCNSLREITTGMLASEQRLAHLGIRYHPRRSTIADANIRRQAEVFEKIYFSILKKYAHFLSDSRTNSKASKIYILDSTTIKLFHDVLRAGGLVPASGKCKGGIKVHTMIRSDQDVPCMIRFSSGVAHDCQYLKEIHLPKGSIIVFDRGYRDFATLNRLTNDGITWITRRTDYLALAEKDNLIKPDTDKSIIYDRKVIIGHRTIKHRVNARFIRYLDPNSGEVYEYFTNNLKMNGSTIVELYRKRWQIELLFKRMKQNYPLKYFLGDSENAIKIQICCSLIADLLLKIVKKAAAARWSFSNLASIVRLHLMTYIDLFGFLKSPEKALLKLFAGPIKQNYNQLSFVT